MKNIVLPLILSLVLQSSAFAQNASDTAAALPKTLAATMKAMSSNLKSIVAQINNPQLNDNSATKADMFTALTLHSKDFSPDSIANLPADQNVAAKAQYDKMLDQTADLGTQLAFAFRSNDTASATVILNQLSQQKSDGHKQFKH
ncbi:hypothetical protein CIK05_06115 [Bdellovibrio sp. qaytius]|nr:hypothetical protein CIK05_06115 [Bdellovibrio sp. qaytius]